MGRKTRDEKPGTDKPEGTPPEAERKQLSPDEAKAVMEQAVVEALKNLGIQPGPDGKPDFSKVKDDPRAKLPEMMMNLFGAVVDSAKAKAGDIGSAAAAPVPVDADNVVDLDTERSKRDRPLSPVEEQIQTNLRTAVSSYVNENFPQGTSEVTVDPGFLKDHGPGLFAALISGFAQAIVPEEIKVDVPSAEGGTQKVTMKVDFASMFKNLGKKVTIQADPPKEPDQS